MSLFSSSYTVAIYLYLANLFAPWSRPSQLSIICVIYPSSFFLRDTSLWFLLPISPYVAISHTKYSVLSRYISYHSLMHSSYSFHNISLRSSSTLSINIWSTAKFSVYTSRLMCTSVRIIHSSPFLLSPILA